MAKPSILIDTNALSHLSQVSIDLNGKSVDKWLWNIFNLHTCVAVRDEFKEGASKASASYKAINRRLKENGKNQNGVKTVPRLRHTRNLEAQWLAPKYYAKTLDDEDKGERHLLCAAAELAYSGSVGKFIVVTDDNTALRKFIRPVMKDHLLAEVWTTLDRLVFLYLTRKEVTSRFAKDAIRDIGGAGSFSIFEFRELGETEAERRLELIKAYHRKIDCITKLRSVFPS